jgi:hypothetical protein
VPVVVEPGGGVEDECSTLSTELRYEETAALVLLTPLDTEDTIKELDDAAEEMAEDAEEMAEDAEEGLITGPPGVRVESVELGVAVTVERPVEVVSVTTAVEVCVSVAVVSVLDDKEEEEGGEGAIYVVVVVIPEEITSVVVVPLGHTGSVKVELRPSERVTVTCAVVRLARPRRVVRWCIFTFVLNSRHKNRGKRGINQVDFGYV